MFEHNDTAADRENLLAGSVRSLNHGFVLLLVLSLAGCGEPKADTETTSPTTRDAATPRLSKIATPVSIPIDQLRQLVDQRLSGEIYRESRQVTTGVTLDLVVNRRNGPVTMEMTDDRLTTRVPLHVNGRVSLGLGPFNIQASESIDADLDVRLSTSVGLNSDWSIAADSAVEIEVSRAEITVPGAALNVSTIVEEVLRRNSDRIVAPLDDYLRNLSIKELVDPVWQKFSSPIQLFEDPSVWLRVRPVGFSLSPPEASNENIRFDIGMEMYLDSLVGERPDSDELGPIPPLRETTAGAGSFQIAIPITLGLDEITRAISDRIVGREDSIGGNATVRWLDIELSGTGDRLFAAAEFEANTGWWIVSELAGRMVLEGRPSYDAATQTLTVVDIDYELESDSTLAGIADWLLHDRLRDRIQAELVFPLDGIMDQIREDLQNKLGSISLGGDGTLEARIDMVQPETIRIHNSTVEFMVAADGTIEVNLTLPLG